MDQTEPHIVIIGGGTGAATILSALKVRTTNLTALISMSDDGGSTGRLRDELGVLPPGDVRQCLVALSEAPQELRDLFAYRFPTGGGLEGHSFGNLFLSAAELMNEDFSEAVRLTAKVLQVKGQVLPVTLTNTRLVMELPGQTVTGEHNVEVVEIPPMSMPNLYLSPTATLTPDAATAIAAADLVVIAPGNLYASLIPALVVDGMSDALKATKAPLVFVCNLVNRTNNTADFTVDNYVEELERFIGTGTIDYVLYNTDLPTPELLEKYALENEFPVSLETTLPADATYKVISGEFISKEHREQNANDTSHRRSLIRHDAPAVVNAIMEIITNG